jgi:hypothetical protein
MPRSQNQRLQSGQWRKGFCEQGRKAFHRLSTLNRLEAVTLSTQRRIQSALKRLAGRSAIRAETPILVELSTLNRLAIPIRESKRIFR